MPWLKEDLLLGIEIMSFILHKNRNVSGAPSWMSSTLNMAQNIFVPNIKITLYRMQNSHLFYFRPK